MVDKNDIAEMVRRIVEKRKSNNMENENFEELPVMKEKPVNIQQPVKPVNKRDEKIFFKCMDCNFKFRAFEYKERPRCPYCSNLNTVKEQSIFKELI
ncbi:hypothetical protein HY500_02400 [Candidatus Woesearchaeota archaeon]|nr:hypothetical protein [Candidatus Woesearchaeota archaeon]